MKFLKRSIYSLAATAALLAAGQASAITTWAFSYSGVGVTASGTFTTAGNAATAEDILSISGQRNGLSILGLVPVEPPSPNFLYDNQFTSVSPYFTEGGMLFNVGGGDSGIVNIYFFEGETFDLRVIGGTAIEVPISFSVAVVPEASTVAQMAVGLFGVGVFMARRRKQGLQPQVA